MSNKNLKKNAIQNNQLKSYLDPLNKHLSNDKLFKKSLSFQQDTENNISYFDAAGNQSNNNLIVDNNKTHTTTNYDRDDSLNDVISFGKQTPFRFENSNLNSFETDNNNNNRNVNLAASYDNGNKSKDNETNNNMSILNLKDTTIDEMFLMQDDGMDKINKNFLQLDTTANKKQLKTNDFFDRINLNPDFDLSFNLDNNDSKFLQSTTRNNSNTINNLGDLSNILFQSASKQENQNKMMNSSSGFLNVSKGGRMASPSRIPVLNASRSKTNLNDSNIKIEESRENIENDLQEENNKNLKEESRNKINGAFKLFMSGSNLNKLTNSQISFNKNEEELANCSDMNKTQQSPVKTLPKTKPESPKTTKTLQTSKKPSRASPFLKKTTKVPVKSPVRETVRAFQKNASTKKSTTSLSSKQLTDEGSERSRPPTTVNINYSADSDDSMMMDNLMNNPTELKKILREGKMDKEQLNQLQENYLHLLEQYAEKENFIDTFRLGYNANMAATAPVTPSINMFQATILPTLQQQYQIRTPSQQPDNKSQNSTLEKTSGTNSVTSGQRYGSHSQAQTPTINIIQNSRQKSFTPNNFQQSDQLSNSTASNNQNFLSTNPSVFVISASNRASVVPQIQENQQDECGSYFGGSGLSNNTNSVNNNSPDNPELEENIVVEQNSKLGILLQTKVLEDKMQSFVTLMKEKQLNKVEQIQVFDSIKNDYENLLKNYEEARENDQTGMLPNELDMDIDLNKELGKMKDLLTDIVEKMNHNLVEITPTIGSITSQEQMNIDNNSCSKSVSSYGNGNELMDQYNRLLDVFNNESDEQRDKSIMDMINQNNQTLLDHDKSLQNTNDHHHHHQLEVLQEQSEQNMQQFYETNSETSTSLQQNHHQQIFEQNIPNNKQKSDLQKQFFESSSINNTKSIQQNQFNNQNYIQSSQEIQNVQIHKGRSPKRTKQPSTTDSLSSESNNSNAINQRGSNNNLLTTHILPTPAKNIRNNNSKKISKVNGHSSSDAPTNNKKQKEQQLQQQAQNVYKQTHAHQSSEMDLDQTVTHSEILDSSIQNENFTNVGLQYQQQQQQKMNGNNRKPKLVRVSRDQPIFSESDYDNTIQGFSSANLNLLKTQEKLLQSAKPTVRQMDTGVVEQKIVKKANRSPVKSKGEEMRRFSAEQIAPQIRHSSKKEAQQQHQQEMRARSSKTSNRSLSNNHNYAHFQQQQAINLSDEETEDVTSKTEVISFTKEDYILQKILLENSENSSSTSSSDRMILSKKKEELRLKRLSREKKSNSNYSLNSNEPSEYIAQPIEDYQPQQQEFMMQQQKKPHKSLPVAKAYEGGSDSCEDLDTISRFPAEEELFGSIQQREPVSKPILQNNRNKNYPILKGESRASSNSSNVKNGYNNNRHHHPNQLEYEKQFKQTSKQRYSEISESISDQIIYESNNSFTESTEMESVIEVNKHSKKDKSKSEMKKELMKRLTDEVEHLKQHILKKHMKKAQSHSKDNMAYKDIALNKNLKKSHSIQNNHFISEGFSEETTDAESHYKKHSKRAYRSQAMLNTEQPHIQQDSHRRRYHDDYWSNNNTNYNRMKNSKSLENFESQLSTPSSSSYHSKNRSEYQAKYIKNPKKPNHYNSHQEVDARVYSRSQAPEIRSYTRPHSNTNELKPKLNKKSSQSTESFNGHHQSQNYKPHLTDKRYLYDCYGRLVSFPSVNSIQTSKIDQKNVFNPYALNEIDPNIIHKKSHHHLHHYHHQKQAPTLSNPVYGSMQQKQNVFAGLSESNLLSNHLYSANNFVIPENQIESLVTEQSATSMKNTRPRKVRYYIREYGGDVSAASDNEALYRRFN